MALLEIDPKLFIICRLCLEDTGIYQIIPTVQQQIKYCFDIDVQPFDGLPQLLCKKCHTLLSDYSTVKKSYIEKQVTLKDRMMLKKEEPPPEADEVVENSQANVTAVTTHGELSVSENSEVNVKSQKKKVSKSKRRNRISSTSSTESANSIITNKKSRKITPNNSYTKTLKSWQKKYTKYFVCKICSLMYKDEKSVNFHYSKHSNLRANHHKIFNVKCMVTLSKLDNKPNITGLNNAVVLNEKRIIQDVNNDYYYILYMAKHKKYLKVDSSDCDILVSYKQKKRRRLNSQSSNETVFIGNKNKTFDTKVSTKTTKPINSSKDLNESKTLPDCINIDDSSDSNMETNKVTEQKKSNSLKVDMRTVENIVTVCRNKYELRLKKSKLAESDSSRALQDSQLKHKMLSFGRKTINTQGVNSTGMLRYLENKNLNVIWEPKKLQSGDRDHNLVRVAAIMMNHDQRAEDDAGWSDVMPALDRELSNIVDQSIESMRTAFININPTTLSVVDNSNECGAGVNQIVLTDVRSVEEINSKKLLNVNPVANPKQLLPKKTQIHEVKQSILASKLHNNFDQNAVNSAEQNNVPDMVLPVITSTKSLAPESTKETRKSDLEMANHNNFDMTIPRIKVKPVSELMNPQKLNIDQPKHNIDPIWNYNQIQNGMGIVENSVNLFVPNTLISQIQNQSSPMLPVSQGSTELPKSSSDYIILDTVDMPNTKTDSPFDYFRDLLLLHGLILIEANADITRDFVCLLKFKVQFKQENKSNPVTLCLSLHSSGNNFCMSIKDGNQINIHIAKMSANWQWEIIKVYQGDVSNKILLNAQKAGQKIYTFTNTFLCLLKSISHKQEQ